METKKPSGCWIAAWVAVAVVILMVLGLIYGLVKVAKSDSSSAESKSPSAPLAGAVQMDFNAPLGPPPSPGDAVPRETFLRFQQDSRITQLAKDAFSKAAQGSQVSWDLQVGELVSKDGAASGKFLLPYAASISGNSSVNGVLSLQVEFTADQTAALLTLRRDDWVRVAGTLDLANGRTTLREAKVVQAP